MKNKTLLPLFATIALSLFVTNVRAQSNVDELPKFEVGVHFTSITKPRIKSPSKACSRCGDRETIANGLTDICIGFRLWLSLTTNLAPNIGSSPKRWFFA